MPALRHGVVVLVVLVGTVACSIGETTHETVTYPMKKRGSAAKTCEGPFAKLDLDTLKACQEGRGHCVDKTRVPSTDDLEACDADTVCLPNKVITAAGEKLKACTFFMGDKPGVCVGLAIPRIVEFKDVLRQDVCDEDERCTPCVNPEDGSPNPLCDAVGVFENACTGGGGKGSRAQSCCHGAGTCMLADSLEEDQREQLARDQCPETKLCVPASQASGKPVKCEILGADGVCIDVCFAEMLKGASRVMRSGCGPTELCMPCAVGKGQGMVGCD